MEQVKYFTEDDLQYGKSGSTLQGTVECSFYDLQCMFGKPTFEGKGDNITTEFIVNYTAEGELAEDGYPDEEDMGQFRLYDWYYSRHFGDDHKVINWNIGGNSYEDEDYFRIAHKLFEETDIRYGFDFDEPCISTDKFIEVDYLLKEAA